MLVEITRRWKGENTTLSTIRVDGNAHQFCLEDKDRGLTSEMSLEEIKRRKVYGKTAIPLGRYQVLINYSARFKRLLPILVGVPGYEGIRIHPGNRHVDTSGCLLPGRVWGKENDDYFVGNSKTSADSLQNAIAAAINRGEKVFIEIKCAY